ncbi:MAG: hypothetical protein ACKVOR_08660 [Flavobacteriales bacterium]
MKRIYLGLICSICAAASFAQSNVDDGLQVLYKKEAYGGISLNMNGYGAFFTYGKYKSAYKLNLFSIDLNFVKHEKETKNYNPWQDPNARPYFYGKQNNFYTIRTAVGKKNIKTLKLRNKGVQIGYSWQAGPSFGFTKPVYLEILYSTEGPIQQQYLQVEKFDPDKHYIDNIYGRASGLRGFDELKFHPGVFAKFAFNFDYSNDKQGLKGIETGIATDVFTHRIPIMAPEILEDDISNPRNHQIFLSAYINFFFGSKFDRK